MIKFNAIRSILFAALLGFMPSVSSAFVAITVAPPPLLVYDQPLCPGDGYIWVPGYWAWDADVGDYYWVPGVWVLAPQVGFLWTPGWWGYGDGGYVWHAGYWGPSVGYYGGIDYGFGYYGSGFVGGAWAGNVFRYNTAVWHVDPAVVHNTYSDPSVARTGNNHVSFNGPGGASVKPTASQEAAMRGHHLAATNEQRQHELAARHDPGQRFSTNHGHPKQMVLSRIGGTGEHKTPAANEAATNHAENRAAVTHQAGQRTAATNRVEHNAAATRHTAAAGRVEHNVAATRHTAAAGRVEHNAAATRHTAAAGRVEHNAATHHVAHNAPATHHAAQPGGAVSMGHRMTQAHQSAHVAFQAHRPAASHPAARPAPHPAARPAGHRGGGGGKGGEKRK